MMPDARLESAVFQLTPTRTRCDLVITANGKTEKIASGLFNPFLAHLKAAQDQIAKGGYSITLRADHGADTSWFTKGTVERFVRFVSTPEVLERVNTIESEILQIDEAIAIQGNESLGLGTVEDHQTRPVEYIEGSKSVVDGDAEKAIVIYKPGTHPPESNGSTVQAENSKVQLLRVLETRKTVLQKEQGMAFARAVAAGFDMDQMAHLISFAECFGASRLLIACVKFMELWKGKHETGQWVEIEAAEAMSMRSEFSSMNVTGIMLSGDSRKQNEWPGSHGDVFIESNGKASSDVGADPNSDKRPSGDPQAPSGPHEYFQGQFPHPMFPQWPMHSPPGGPVFQPYPMQGMPYYQNYPGGPPFFQPPYAPMEDPKFNSQRRKTKKHSTDSKDSNDESENWEAGVPSNRSHDEMDQNTSELERETSEGRGSHRKSGRSGKKQSGVVVIRNINYITSKKHNASGSESESASNSETEEETEELHSEARERRHKKSSRSSKIRGGQTKSIETLNSYDDPIQGQETGSDNWQAFQSFLLRDEDDKRGAAMDQGIFSGEKVHATKRRQSNSGTDPILYPDRDFGDSSEHRMVEFDTINGGGVRRNKPIASSDDLIHSKEGRGLRENELDVKFQEMEGGRGGYRRGTSDDFMIYGHERQPTTKSSLDPLTENAGRFSSNLEKGSQPNVTDESFIVPYRSGSQDQLGTDSRTAIDMDSEFPSTYHRTEESFGKVNQVNYEPDYLRLMPKRDIERESIGYDPAIDYDMEAHVDNNTRTESGTQETSPNAKEGVKKSDKEKKSRILKDGLEKRKADTLRRGKPSKLNPLVEAQARAEKLRAYKADLQKEKKQKEEEEIKRLEALKRERQKRIAARGSSSAIQSQSTPLQNRARLPTKISPSSVRGSKFSDSEPGSSSPLQKLPIRTSVGSSDSKTTRTNRPSGTHSIGNGLSRSVSSLSEMKKDTSGQKPASVTRRLSDPKGSVVNRASSVTSARSDHVAKQSAPDLNGNKIRHASVVKSESRDRAPKNISDEPQIKKISAIMNLDKSKSATLPEIKIRTPVGSSDTVQNKLTTNEAVQKVNGSKSSLRSENGKTHKENEKAPQISDGNDSLVIEKTVVMLEEEPVPVLLLDSEKMMEKTTASYGSDKGEKVEIISEYAVIRAPPPPIIASGLMKDTSESLSGNKPASYEVAIECARDESQKFSSSIPTKKPYEAPYARISSMEDSSMININHTEAPPLASSEMAKTGTKIIEIHTSSFADSSSAEHFPEIMEKHQAKESSKGFKRLLKFGRKSHSSASEERTVDSDSSSVDDHMVAVVSSTEASTLKNLISEDDPHSGNTPKASRSFSILSPFRSKTSEKKTAV